MPCLVLLVAMVSVLGSLGLQPFLNQSPNGVEVSYAVTVLSALSFWMNLLIIKYGWVNYALGVLWSLSVEEVFYLAFPVLCLGFGRGKGFIVFLLAVIAYAPYFRALHFGEESGAYLYHYFSSFDGIAIGCLTAMYVQHFKGAIYKSKSDCCCDSVFDDRFIFLCTHQRGEYLGHQRIYATYGVTHIVFYSRPES